MRFFLAAAMAVAVVSGAAVPSAAGGCNDDVVARLVDRNAVLDTVHRLFISTDRRDWTAVNEVFAPKVRFDMTSMGAKEPVVLTPRQITGAWDDGLKHLTAVHHQVGNHRIEWKDNGAAVFCYGIASHYLPGAEGEDVRTFVGSYDLHLIKTAGEWRIDAFKFNLKYIGGNADLEGKNR